MRKWPIVAIVVALVIAAGVFVATRLLIRLPGYVRERAIETMREHFASDVQFRNFQVSLFPVISISGEDLVLRYQGRTDVPPLITIRKFSARSGLVELLRKPSHIRRVMLNGLKISLPPRSQVSPPPEPPKRKGPPPFKVDIGEIISDNDELDMLPRDPKKGPRIFLIQHLVLSHAGLGRVMSFRAALTNPVPKGQINTQGQFGPWKRDNPELTPVKGDYTFTHADMNTIRGLGGMLSSRGKFAGLLERIDVVGETTTPNFSLDIANHPIPLETQFHAIVDGTSANTLLNPVRAKLGTSWLTARGGVFRTTGDPRRTVLLDASSTHAKMEDLLRLVLKTETPPITGYMNFKTSIDIPPGDVSVADRMRLRGHFDVTSAHFSKLNIEQKVAAFSRRARGQLEQTSQGSVVFNLKGNFVLRDGIMKFSGLTFGIPGATVRLDGTYKLRGEKMDFRGTLALQAQLSQLIGGWKSYLLKPLDPLFSRGGAGTLLPITVTGTGSDPHFGVDIARVFRP